MIKLGYCRISELRTKFFYETGGENNKCLEFYIDRDPETGLADLWIRPGETEAVPEFVTALVLEGALAKSNENPKPALDKSETKVNNNK